MPDIVVGGPARTYSHLPGWQSLLVFLVAIVVGVVAYLHAAGQPKLWVSSSSIQLSPVEIAGTRLQDIYQTVASHSGLASKLQIEAGITINAGSQATWSTITLKSDFPEVTEILDQVLQRLESEASAGILLARRRDLKERLAALESDLNMRIRFLEQISRTANSMLNGDTLDEDQRVSLVEVLVGYMSSIESLEDRRLVWRGRLTDLELTKLYTPASSARLIGQKSPAAFGVVAGLSAGLCVLAMMFFWRDTLSRRKD